MRATVAKNVACAAGLVILNKITIIQHRRLGVCVVQGVSMSEIKCVEWAPDNKALESAIAKLQADSSYGAIQEAAAIAKGAYVGVPKVWESPAMDELMEWDDWFMLLEPVDLRVTTLSIIRTLTK